MARSLGEAIGELKRGLKKFRPGSLLSLMKEQGFVVKETGEGWLLHHPDLAADQLRLISVANPHGRQKGNVVRPGYVKNCLRALERLEELREEE